MLVGGSVVDGKGSLEVFPVQPGDVADGDAFGANGFTIAMVGKVEKAIFVPMHDPGDGSLLGLLLTLRKTGEM